MSNRIDRVRAVMAAPEDIDVPEDLRAEAVGQTMDDPGSVYDDLDPPPAPPPQEEGDADPPEARCVAFPLNDLGNAKRVLEHFGPDLMFVPRVGWYVWRDLKWEADPDDILVRRHAHRLTELIAKEVWHLKYTAAQETILLEGDQAAEIIEEIGATPVKDRTEEQNAQYREAAKAVEAARDLREGRSKTVGRLLTHAKNAGNSNAIKNMLIEASAIIARPLDDLDALPLDINTESGVLRFSTVPDEFEAQFLPPGSPVPLRGWVELVPHHREQLLTKIMPVVFDPDAKAPQFERFLERVQPVPEMRRFLQRWLGLSLTGLTNEQKFAFFYGVGANGKSVLVDLIARMAGDYAASAKIESLTGRNRRGGGDATPDLMPLIGARFVRASEPDQNQQLQEGLIKELTGGEPILVRALNENFVLVRPIFKLTISGNHRPEIRGGDEGIWRRVMLVPFDVHIPPQERDPELGEKLWAERSGILNWLIEGLQEYLAHGLQVPDSVIEATQEYREDSDPLGAFLTSCCHVSGSMTDEIGSRELGQAFNFWLEETGRTPWGLTTVSKKIAEKTDRWVSPGTGKTFARKKKSNWYCTGIRLAEPFATRFKDAPRDAKGNVLLVAPVPSGTGGQSGFDDDR